MTLRLDLSYNNPNYTCSEKNLYWDFRDSPITSWDLPYKDWTIIAINQTYWDVDKIIDWKRVKNLNWKTVWLAMTWPQMITSWNFDHTWKVWAREIIKAEKVNIWFVKYNQFLLMILLHKALWQVDMWTDYILQILKKIWEWNDLIEWKYEWSYNSFYDWIMKDNWWALKISEETLQIFLSWYEIEWITWPSSASIIRV